MRLIVSRKATRDIATIHSYIAKDNRRAADALVERFYGRVERLIAAGFPDMGSRGRVIGTRHLVEGRYVVVYRHDRVRDEIVVLSVTHGARRR